MHRIGILSKVIIQQWNIEEGYRLMKKAGFDAVDFNFDEYLGTNAV